MSPLEDAHEDLVEALRKWREYRHLNDLDEDEDRLAAAWDAYEKELEGRP